MKPSAHVVLSILLSGVVSCDRVVIVGDGPDSGADDAGRSAGGTRDNGGSGGAAAGASGGETTGSGGAGGATAGGGGTSAGAGGSSGNSGSSGAGGNYGGDASNDGADPRDARPMPPLACSGPAGTPWIDDESEGGTFAQYYTGRWLLCSSTGFLGTSDEVGLEIDYRGHWYKLYATPTGGLERGSGFDKEGTWTYTGQQIVFQIFGGGTAYAWSSLTKDPKRMRLNNNSVWISDYIEADLDDDAGVAPRECSMGGTPYVPPSTPAIADAMLGSWILCARPSPFGTNDELGLEFTSTGATKGEWFKLYATSTGTVRGSGINQQGTWYFPDSLDGSTTQLNIAVSGGEIYTFPSFTTSPRKMRIAGGTGPSATYVNVVP
jgi:hypothetical protein